MRRRRMSRRGSRKSFKRYTGVNKRNVRRYPMRGGIRF